MNITTSDAQKCAIKCSGENAINLQDVNSSNWVSVRNEFLHNVHYNGARSHRDIINVLEWFDQFNLPELTECDYFDGDAGYCE